jgi:putative oxidoreductase
MSRGELISYGTLLLRVALGVMFLAHGLMKLLVQKPSGTVAYFRSLNLPGVFAYLTILGEVGGGLLLLVGFLTSVISILLIPLVLGTIFIVHGAKGWLFSNEGGGWEYPAFWSVTLVVQAMLGSGAFSLGNAFGIGWL